MTRTFTPADLAKALASGDYPQAHDQLRVRRDGEIVGYCCIGVAAKMAGCSDKYLDDVDVPHFHGLPGEEHGYVEDEATEGFEEINAETKRNEDKLKAAFPWLDVDKVETLLVSNDNDTSGTFEAPIAELALMADRMVGKR